MLIFEEEKGKRTTALITVYLGTDWRDIHKDTCHSTPIFTNQTCQYTNLKRYRIHTTKDLYEMCCFFEMVHNTWTELIRNLIQCSYIKADMQLLIVMILDSAEYFIRE